MFNLISQKTASMVKVAGLGRNLALAGGGLATLGALGGLALKNYWRYHRRRNSIIFQ